MRKESSLVGYEQRSYLRRRLIRSKMRSKMQTGRECVGDVGQRRNLGVIGVCACRDSGSKRPYGIISAWK